MDVWKEALAEVEKAANGSGIFVKLAGDGDKVVGVFCGEPLIRKTHWNGERHIECLGTRACAECEAGTRLATKVALNFFVLPDRAMKVIEGGPDWFKTVIALRDKYGLDRYAFEIKRHGAARDPKTKYTMLPDQAITTELAEVVRRAPLHDLTKIGKEDGEGEGAAAVERSRMTAAAPRDAIATADLHALAEQLRPLPRADLEAFLRAFNVGRLRELRAADLPEARAYLARRASPAVDELPEEEPWC